MSLICRNMPTRLPYIYREWPWHLGSGPIVTICKVISPFLGGHSRGGAINQGSFTLIWKADILCTWSCDRVQPFHFFDRVGSTFSSYPYCTLGARRFCRTGSWKTLLSRCLRCKSFSCLRLISYLNIVRGWYFLMRLPAKERWRPV